MFAISIVTWSSPEFTHICGPHPYHYDCNGTSQGTGQLAAGIEGGEEELSSTESCESTPDWLQQVNENSPLGCGEYGRQTVQRVKRFLPGALCILVSMAPWDGMRSKVRIWFVVISFSSTSMVPFRMLCNF